MRSHQGPLMPTQRVIVPGTWQYVEIRQDDHGHGICWAVEFGDNRWGHRGTWGRCNAMEASRIFTYALKFLTKEKV